MFTMGPYVLFDQSNGPPTPMTSPEMYFAHMEHSAHPHIPPDAYNSKSANFVSDDLISSQNRYFRTLDQTHGQQTVQREGFEAPVSGDML